MRYVIVSAFCSTKLFCSQILQDLDPAAVAAAAAAAVLLDVTGGLVRKRHCYWSCRYQPGILEEAVAEVAVVPLALLLLLVLLLLVSMMCRRRFHAAARQQSVALPTLATAPPV